MTTHTLTYLAIALGLLGSFAYADKFPFAEGTFDANNKLTHWSLDRVRTYRNDTIGKLKNDDGSEKSVPQKDAAADPNKLNGYASHDVETKSFTTDIDLTDVSGLVYVAIHVDDIANLTVTEIDDTGEPIGTSIPYNVQGSALWRAEKSYNEFPNPILGGKKYRLNLDYTNTVNLTKQYNGPIDYDGVNVFLMHHPAVDLDVDSDNSEGFEFTWGSEPEDKIEASPSLPGKIIAVPIEPDADNDGIPDYKDFGGISSDPKKQFVQMVVHLPPNYDPETATVTFDYPMSAATKSSSAEPPNSGFRIWTKNGDAPRSLDDIPVAPPAAPYPAPGYLVKDGDPILWKNLAANCQGAEAGRYPGPALILYLETVITYKGGSLSTSQPEKIKVTAKNGSSSDELETQDLVNITVRCTGGVQLSGVKALLVNDDDDNGDEIPDKDNDRLAFVDNDVQPITVKATALDQAIKVTIDSNELYTTVGTTPSGSGGLIDGVYPGKRLTNGVASGSDAEGQSKIGWKEGIYTIDVPANSTIVQNLYIEGLRESAAIDDVVIDAVILTPSVPAGKKLAQATATASHKLTVIAADIVPDSGQSGTTGDLIASNKGASGEKHYVSPKKSNEIPDDFVVLKATGIAQDRFIELLEWDGGEAHPTDPMKRHVKRDRAAKTIVKIKVKQDGAEAVKMNVWVVWAITQPRVGTIKPLPDPDWFEYRIGIEEDKNWRFKFTIEPAGIITDADRPALHGNADLQKNVPGHNKPFPIDPDPNLKADTAINKWDVSRQLSVSLRNPGLITKAQLEEHFTGQWTDGQPQNLHTPVPYPTNPVEGNDDPFTLDEENNPYAVSNQMGLEHQIGEIASFDAPGWAVLNSWGKVADQEFVAMNNFREFARVQLWDGKRVNGNFWFRISDYGLWHHSLKAKFDLPTGKWKDNGSSAALGNIAP